MPRSSFDDTRYGEHKPTVDLDVVMHFGNNAFNGLSFDLALALADKLARYSPMPYPDCVVATGLVGCFTPGRMFLPRLGSMMRRVITLRFDPVLIHDTYACRRGKSTPAAVRRAQQFTRKFPYVLQCDVRKYDDSVDHAVLKALLRR